jgi:hypothetical protein
MKYLQHTSETSETLETFVCNMRFFLPWCLRPTTRDDVPADDDLLLVEPGRWWHGALRGYDGPAWAWRCMATAARRCGMAQDGVPDGDGRSGEVEWGYRAQDGDARGDGCSGKAELAERMAAWGDFFF